MVGLKGPPEVRGIGLDARTRCAHYHSALDIVAIRTKCCGVYYACVHCHTALAGHPIAAWPVAEQDSLAVRCGNCALEMSVTDYLAANNRCPRCAAGFNPHCRDHYPDYFATASGT